jgi:tubulin-specific chaperone E
VLTCYSGNRFRDIKLSDIETQYFRSIFTKVKSLSLEETYLTWNEVRMSYCDHLLAYTNPVQLADTANLFVNLTYLSASGNALKSLTPSTPPTSLKTIILEKNGFTSISDIAALTALPNLEQLTLKNNSISQTHPPDTAPPIFSPTLTSLDISSNEISAWGPIDALPRLFPGLGSLRISRNPLFNSLVSPSNEPLSADDGYLLAVARLAPLHTLNFSHIPAQERTNAELWYLSQIAAELSLRPPTSAEAIIAEHPRYHELCRLYDRDPAAALQSAGQTGNPRSLAARLIMVEAKLSNAAAAEAGTRDKAATLEIPRGFSVYAALGLIGKRFGLWPMGLKLVWETGEWDFERGDVVEDEEWDSEVEEGEGEAELGRRVPREVAIWPSTKPFGTQVDGERAVVRVELRDERT